MAIQKEDDQRPGPAPVVRRTDGSITFEFSPARPDSGERLVIRCEIDGQISARIARPANAQ